MLHNLAEEWFKKAEEDYVAAKVLLEEGSIPNVVCFHAQQVAEKYLKGFLVFRGADVEKIHAVERLVELCSEFDPEFSSIQEDAVQLSTFYIQTRYPGDAPQFTFNQAQDAIHNAERIRQTVLDKIKA